MYIKDFLKKTKSMSDQQIIKIKGKEGHGVGFQVEGPWYFLFAKDSRDNITLGHIRCWAKKTKRKVPMSLRVDVLNKQAFSSIESFIVDDNLIIINPKGSQT